MKSLQLVKEMLMDETLSGKLMVIGTCRGNEVAYTDDLSISLREFEDLYNLTILSIELRNLQLGDVQNVVENFLQSFIEGTIESRVCRDISHFVYHTTGGNPMAVNQLFWAIIEYRVIRQSTEHGALSWQPDLVSSLNLSDNDHGMLDPVDIVLARIRLLPRDLKELLRIAACFGFVFSAECLDHVIDFNLEFAMEAAEKLELITKCDHGEKQYKFSHDKVQQASYQHVGDETIEKFHLDLGNNLLRALDEDEVQKEAVLIASQLIRARNLLHSDSDRVMFARLCLQASMNLAKQSDFAAALSFLDAGRDSLKDGHWHYHYELSYTLYQFSAEISNALGKHEAVSRLVNNMISNACNSTDRARAKIIRVHSLGIQNRLVESVDESIVILSDLGERVPRNVSKLGLTIEFFLISRRLRRMSNQDILTLPVLRDTDSVRRLLQRVWGFGVLQASTFCIHGNSAYSTGLDARARSCQRNRVHGLLKSLGLPRR